MDRTVELSIKKQFKKIKQVRSMIENNPPVIEDYPTSIDIEMIKNHTNTKRHPIILHFSQRCSEVFSDWNFRLYNQNMESLIITNSAILNSRKKGMGDGFYLPEDNRMHIDDPRNKHVFMHELTHISSSYYQDTELYKVSNCGFSFWFHDKSGKVLSSESTYTVGTYMNEFVTDYLVIRRIGSPGYLPESVIIAVEKLIELIGEENLYLYATGDSLRLMDELSKYMDHKTMAILYSLFDLLSMYPVRRTKFSFIKPEFMCKKEVEMVSAKIIQKLDQALECKYRNQRLNKSRIRK